MITFAREDNEEVIWDVTNGFEDSYGDIVDEILSEVTPDYIVVPIGTGEIYVGIVRKIKSLGIHTKVVGIGIIDRHSSIADKLITMYTPYKRVMKQYAEEGHTIYRLTDDEVKKQYDKYNYIATSEPSSTVVYAAAEKHNFKKGDKIVFINTGTSKHLPLHSFIENF